MGGHHGDRHATIDAVGVAGGGQHDNLTAALIDVDTDNQMNSIIPPVKKKKSFIQIMGSILKSTRR